MIAARQATLDLTHETPDGRTVTRRPVRTTLHLHLSLADLTTHLTAATTSDDTAVAVADFGAPVIGEAERLGPVTVDLIRTWLADSTATIHPVLIRPVIRPVLDLARTDTVDRHDPPPWMRELVVLRDRHCVFPWCGRDARACDLDHIQPYLPPDEDGPPGQTSPDNLAALCRRHHRAKTFAGWAYRRARDGTYTWTSPHGRTYTVGPHGTTATTPPPTPAPAHAITAAYTLAT